VIADAARRPRDPLAERARYLFPASGRLRPRSLAWSGGLRLPDAVAGLIPGTMTSYALQY
jgi:hypothetical protein